MPFFYVVWAMQTKTFKFPFHPPGSTAQVGIILFCCDSVELLKPGTGLCSTAWPVWGDFFLPFHNLFISPVGNVQAYRYYNLCLFVVPFFFFPFRYQYYLQVKKDVLDGRLISSFEQGIRLAGLAVQGRKMWPHSPCPGVALLVCPLPSLGTEALHDSYSQQLGFQLIPKCMGGLPQGENEGPHQSTQLSYF